MKLVKKIVNAFKDEFKYSESYIDYPEVGIITDADVRKFVRAHTHWWQRLNWKHMVDWGMFSQNVLMGVYKITDKDLKKKSGSSTKRWRLTEQKALRRNSGGFYFSR